jgi:hypothetical protein
VVELGWLRDLGINQNAYSGNNGAEQRDPANAFPRNSGGRFPSDDLGALLVGWSTTASLAQLDITPRDQKGGSSQKKVIGNEMGVLSKRLRVCLDSQALAVAPKPVDLETASVAVMARCEPELQQMRKFLYTGIAGFSPDPDYWSKEIEPVYLKEAGKAVAVARTRDTPLAPAKPKTPPKDDRNKI